MDGLPFFIKGFKVPCNKKKKNKKPYKRVKK